MFNESVAIFRMLGRENGYYPKGADNWKQCWAVDSIVDHSFEFMAKFVMPLMKAG